MTKQIDFDKYALFVDGVTSDSSKDYQCFIESISSLDGKGANIHRLLTAAVGISAEGGEFMEIVKKMVFQGKPWNDDNREHLIIELGDVMWYVAQACMALDISFDEVLERNVSGILASIQDSLHQEKLSYSVVSWKQLVILNSNKLDFLYN